MQHENSQKALEKSTNQQTLKYHPGNENVNNNLLMPTTTI